MVTFSNLAEFKAGAMRVLGAINRDLQTDEDFADAEQTVKWAKERPRNSWKRSRARRCRADRRHRNCVPGPSDEVSAETHRIRTGSKSAGEGSEAVRGEIVAASVAAVRALRHDHGTTMGENSSTRAVAELWTSARGHRGQKSIASMRDAVDAAAAAKDDANQKAGRIRTMRGHHRTNQLDPRVPVSPTAWRCAASKNWDDLRSNRVARIAEHERREAARREQNAERIRQEETDRIERERQCRGSGKECQ